MNHKSRGWAPAIALLATLPILWLHGAAQAPKPVLTNKIYTYFIGPPDTLKEMILAADAVVYGRILAAAANDSVSPIGGALVRTAYRVKVNELLHTLGGHPIDTSHIVVLREGGDRDRGTHIERVVQENFPSFSVGGEYVLFLRWNSESTGMGSCVRAGQRVSTFQGPCGFFWIFRDRSRSDRKDCRSVPGDHSQLRWVISETHPKEII